MPSPLITKIEITQYRLPYKDTVSTGMNVFYEAGATTKGFYSIMDKIIRTGSRIAITISEKI